MINARKWNLENGIWKMDCFHVLALKRLIRQGFWELFLKSKTANKPYKGDIAKSRIVTNLKNY